VVEPALEGRTHQERVARLVLEDHGITLPSTP
jgi:hypothetical protein